MTGFKCTQRATVQAYHLTERHDLKDRERFEWTEDAIRLICRMQRECIEELKAQIRPEGERDARLDEVS